jgi:hypothetical protein
LRLVDLPAGGSVAEGFAAGCAKRALRQTGVCAGVSRGRRSVAAGAVYNTSLLVSRDRDIGPFILLGPRRRPFVTP